MAHVNDYILYQPDEQPSHPASLALGFQNVMTRIAGMAATASIIAVAGGQSQGYLSWIFSSALVICGLGSMLDCVGLGPRKCLEVNGRFFYEGIDGFKHEEGYTYRLKIEQYDAFPGEK